MLYDYFTAGGYAALVGYGLLGAVCLGAFVYLLVSFVRWVRRGVRGFPVHVALYAAACLLPLIPLVIGIIPQTAQLVSAQVDYTRRTCDTVTGELSAVSVTECEGYRGETAYAVTFTVDGVVFSGASLRTDKETADRLLSSAGTRVTVCYETDSPQNDGTCLVLGIQTATP